MLGVGPFSSPQETVGKTEECPASHRAIPVGVFADVFADLTVEELIEKIEMLGLDAVEIGTGAYVSGKYCHLEELVADPAKAKAWRKQFEVHGIQIGAMSCHGNPLHPDPQIAQSHSKVLHDTILLADRLDVPVVVCFSGCPGGSPNANYPNWATYRWPPDFEKVLEWQWNEKVLPYWKTVAKFAKKHSRRIAIEMEPGFVVYNPETLLRLRTATGDYIGANCDLSHLFWQGCNPAKVIHFLARNGALYHAHMKDTVLFPNRVGLYGVLNFSANPSEIFRAVGYGHSAELWKDVVRAYMEVGFEGIMSIENEDPFLPGATGVQRAAYVLKNVQSELLSKPNDACACYSQSLKESS